MKPTWEMFCDEGYYHMWAVRPVGSRKFSEAIHVVDEVEAQRLVNLLSCMDAESRCRHVFGSDGEGSSCYACGRANLKVMT